MWQKIATDEAVDEGTGCAGSIAALVASSHRVVALLLLGMFSLNRIFAIVFTSVRVTVSGLFLGLVQDICVTSTVLFGLSLLWLLFLVAELLLRRALSRPFDERFASLPSTDWFFPDNPQIRALHFLSALLRAILAISSSVLCVAVTAVVLADIGVLSFMKHRCPRGSIEFVTSYSLGELVFIVAEQTSMSIALLGLTLLVTIFALYFGIFLQLPSEWSVTDEIRNRGNVPRTGCDVCSRFANVSKLGLLAFVLLSVAGAGSTHRSARVHSFLSDIRSLDNIFFFNELSVFHSDGPMMYLPSALHVVWGGLSNGLESVGYSLPLIRGDGSSAENRRDALLELLGINQSREDFKLQADEAFRLRRLTHHYQGKTTFSVRQHKKPTEKHEIPRSLLEEPQNDMLAKHEIWRSLLEAPQSNMYYTKRRLPHIVNFVMEGVRSEDVEMSLENMHLMPNLQKLMSRGVYWSRAYSMNFHTNTGYPPMYFGVAPGSKRSMTGKLKRFGYIAMLKQNLGYATHFVSDVGDGSKAVYGFEKTNIWRHSNEYDGSFSSIVNTLFEEHVNGTKDKIPLYLEVRPEGTHPPHRQGHQVSRLPEYEDELKPHFIGVGTALRSMFVTDRFIGEVLRNLREFDVKAREKGGKVRPILIVVCSDHGYSIAQGRQTWRDTQFRIPFMIADLADSKDAGSGVLDPKDWGKRINDTTASNVDFWPTIYDVLGVREFEHVGLGRSLMRHPPSTTYTFSAHASIEYIVRRWTPKTKTRHHSSLAHNYNFTKFMFMADEGGKVRSKVFDLLNDTMERHSLWTDGVEQANLPGELLQMKKIYEAVVDCVSTA